MADVKWSLYVHTSPSGKRYVGITCRACEDRWLNGNGYKQNAYFFNAIRKYGWDNFTHDVLFIGLNEEHAKQLESIFIAEYQSNNPSYGYNRSAGGEGKSGFIPTEETKTKIRTALTGTHRPTEVRLKLSKAHTGKSLTSEHKQKIRDSCKHINGKPVICLTTGIVYFSAVDASKRTGVSHSGITACCRGETEYCQKSTDGTRLVWAYLESER